MYPSTSTFKNAKLGMFRSNVGPSNNSFGLLPKVHVADFGDAQYVAILTVDFASIVVSAVGFDLVDEKNCVCILAAGLPKNDGGLGYADIVAVIEELRSAAARFRCLSSRRPTCV